MAIDLQCSCGRKLRIGEEHAGKQGQCPACGQLLDIPAPEPPVLLTTRAPALPNEPWLPDLPIPSEEDPFPEREPTPPPETSSREPPRPAPEATVRPPIYFPGPIALATLLGGPLAGFLLMARNYARTRNVPAGVWCVLLGIVGAAGLWLVYRLAEGGPAVLVVHLGGVLLMYLLAQRLRPAWCAEPGFGETLRVPAGRAAGVGLACGLLLVPAGYFGFLLVDSLQGGQVTFGTGERVLFTAPATREQARRLGRVLQQEKVFNNTGPKEVFLRKRGDTFRVSFLLQTDAWDRPEVILTFRRLHDRMVDEVFDGGPLQIRLCDRFRGLRRTVQEGLGKRLTFGDEEELYYARSIPEGVARRLGRKLQELGFFDGKGPKVVRLTRDGDKYLVSFVADEEALKDPKPALVAELKDYCRILAGEVFEGRTVHILLCDEFLSPKQTID